MADLSKIKEHQEVVGADGVHVGKVDKVEGDRIKLMKADSGQGSHKGHHHYISGGLVAAVEGDKVRLSANAANAVMLEEESSGEGVGEKGSTLKKVAIGAAAVAGVAAVGAVVYKKVKGSGDKDDSDDKAGA